MIKFKFKCDKCGGPVWHDIESSKHYDMACIICGKRWFVKKDIYKRVTERKMKRRGRKTPGARGALFMQG